MTLTKTLSLAAFAGLATISGATFAVADEAASAKVLAPLKAATFQFGSKQAVAYYQSEQKSCKVTVVIADSYDDTAVVHALPVRFNTSVVKGTSALLDTMDGPSLQLTCVPGGSNLKVRTVERTAYVRPLNGVPRQ